MDPQKPENLSDWLNFLQSLPDFPVRERADHITSIDGSMNTHIPVNESLRKILDKEPLKDSRGADNKVMLTPLTHLAPLVVKGGDSEKFLQGQISTNMKDLVIPEPADALQTDKSYTSQYRLGACCTPKGRMVTSFTAVQSQPQHYLLIMDRPLVQATHDHLKKFSVFFRQTKMASGEDDMVGIGLTGSELQLSQLLKSIGVKFNFSDPFAVTHHLFEDDDLSTVFFQRGVKSADLGPLSGSLDSQGSESSTKSLKRIEVWAQPHRCAVLFQSWKEQCQLTTSQTWLSLDANALFPQVTIESRELWIPQMLNLQKINGISFSKGCYTGQEIVARMQYLGKSKRGTYSVRIDAKQNLSEVISAGMPIFSDKKGSSVGELVNLINISTSENPEDRFDYIGMMVLEHDKVDSTLRLSESNDSSSIQANIKVFEPPYAIIDDPEAS